MEQDESIDSKVRYLGKNTIVFAISSFGTKILSFLLVPLYTNTLSTAEYGIADLISATSTLLIYILTINVDEGVLRYTIDNKEKKNDILSLGIRILYIGTIICSAILCIVYLTGVLDWPLYYYVFTLLYFFFTSLYQIMLGHLRGLEKVKSIAIAGIVAAGTMIASNIICLLVVRIGVIGYLLSHVLGVIVGAIYCIVIAKEQIKTYFINSCDKGLANQIRKYCFPLVFNNIALWINAFLDRFFVTAICGVSENGIYSVALKIPTILATFYSVFSQAWNLTTLKSFDKEDDDGFFSKMYGVYNAATCIACSGLVFLNTFLARILYANDFYDAWKYSSILLLFVMWNSLTIFLSSIFNAVKNTKIIAKTTVISALTNTVLNAVLIQVYGATGAAIATVISYLVMWGIRLYYSKQYIKMRIDLSRDIITYIIIIIQVILDHYENHMYPIQVICCLLIFMIQKKNLGLIIRRIKDKIKILRKTNG